MKGLGVSQGIGIGKVFIIDKQELKIQKREIQNIEEEIQKLKDSIQICKQQIQNLYKITQKNIGEEEAQIFKAHEMIVCDEMLFGEIKAKIEKENINVEYALKEVTDIYVDMFQKIDDEYMRERSSDIKDVATRLIKILIGVNTTDITKLKQNTIIVANDLSPSETAQIDKAKVTGIITQTGGTTSHTAIMARTMEIPAVVGVSGILGKIQEGQEILCDGSTGIVIINPTQNDKQKYLIKKEQQEKLKYEQQKLKGKQTITKDGFKVELSANIGITKDVEAVLKYDAEGIGLFRSEFLYMDKSKLPTEEEQYQAYKDVLQKMEQRPVIIRTLDIGGDKELPYLKMPKELNPFLGYRAIRLCLDQKDIFKTQLRAILRASEFGNVKIMFPMISSIEELRQAKSIYEKTKQELKQENIKIKEDIQIGIMIEIPSAAIISDILAKEVDFFSIGTNDLIQYTTAVDRTNTKISHLFNQYHPAVLRLIKMVIDNSHKSGIWTGMCGEAAGDTKLIPVLIGMGLDEFSMSANLILRARHIIRNLSKKDMEEIVDQVINMASANEVEEYLNQVL